MRRIQYPFKMASRSSRALARRVGALRVRPNGRYRPRRSDVVVNWGSARQPDWDMNVPRIFLNMPEAVNIASNKLLALRALDRADVSIPRFATTVAETRDWNGVVVRHQLRANSGRGVEIHETDYAIPNAPLYTELIDSRGEYRVHVFNGEVIDYCKKRRYRGNEASTLNERRVRSHSNGWIFSREHLGNPLRRLERIEQLAIDAVEALGLDFGGVDIVMAQDRTVYCLEVNTAVGMEGTTLDLYEQAIREL